ncbi:hypothetical protein EJ110_NYTH05212 [Nymphaea thermarum]|nr:hypothetical protein EJ110_NYTH05212 [Nymphaea thermarum]
MDLEDVSAFPHLGAQQMQQKLQGEAMASPSCNQKGVKLPGTFVGDEGCEGRGGASTIRQNCVLEGDSASAMEGIVEDSSQKGHLGSFGQNSVPSEADGFRVKSWANVVHGSRAQEEAEWPAASLVRSLYGGRQNVGLDFKHVFQELRRLWGSVANPRFSIIGNGRFLVRVSSEEELEMVLRRRTWSVGGRFLIASRWKPGMEMKINEEESVPIWIHLPALPSVFWADYSYKSIAQALGGSFVRADSCMLQMERLGYARICIEVPLSFQPIPKISMGVDGVCKHIQEVWYENRVRYCHRCGATSHFSNMCKLQGVRSEEEESRDEWSKVKILAKSWGGNRHKPPNLVGIDANRFSVLSGGEEKITDQAVRSFWPHDRAVSQAVINVSSKGAQGSQKNKAGALVASDRKGKSKATDSSQASTSAASNQGAGGKVTNPNPFSNSMRISSNYNLKKDGPTGFLLNLNGEKEASLCKTPEERETPVLKFSSVPEELDPLCMEKRVNSRQGSKKGLRYTGRGKKGRSPLKPTSLVELLMAHSPGTKKRKMAVRPEGEVVQLEIIEEAISAEGEGSHRDTMEACEPHKNDPNSHKLHVTMSKLTEYDFMSNDTMLNGRGRIMAFWKKNALQVLSTVEDTYWVGVCLKDLRDGKEFVIFGIYLPKRLADRLESLIRLEVVVSRVDGPCMWITEFGGIGELKVTTSSTSDHSCLMYRNYMKGRMIKGRRPFRLFKPWIMDIDGLDIVKKEWAAIVTGCPMIKLLKKLGCSRLLMDDGIWAQVYKDKYLQNNSFWTLNGSVRGSWGWKGLVWGWRLIQDKTKWKLGDGSRCRFWLDPWHGRPLIQRISGDNLGNIAMELNISVQDKVRSGRRDMNGMVEVSTELSDILESILQSTDADQVEVAGQLRVAGNSYFSDGTNGVSILLNSRGRVLAGELVVLDKMFRYHKEYGGCICICTRVEALVRRIRHHYDGNRLWPEFDRLVKDSHHNVKVEMAYPTIDFGSFITSHLKEMMDGE